MDNTGLSCFNLFMNKIHFKKMEVEATEPVSYKLGNLNMNDLIGSQVSLEFTSEINCIACGRDIKKTFSQGFCFPCSQSRADADICILKPELCHHGFPENPCRDEEFAQSVCFKPHVLYAALTSGVKVGITRQVNVPSRWIDQGATAAIPLAQLPDRFTVGQVEHELAQKYADKTHWMTMLKTQHPEGNLEAVVEMMLDDLDEMGVEILDDSEMTQHNFEYPVEVWPTKISSLNLDKTPKICGKLNGIKGQYLMLDCGVLNVRKFTGYQVVVK